MAIDLGVDAAGVVRMLRYLEREYRGLRLSVGDGPDRIFEGGRWRLDSQLGKAFAIAYRAGLLPPEIADDIAGIERDIEAGGSVPLLVATHFSLVPHIVGYSEIESIDSDGNPGGDHRFLAPGTVELVWPEIFDGVWLNNETGGADDPAIVAAVLGLHAEACRLFADWIEQNPTGSDTRGHYLDKTMRCDSAADVRVRLIILANQIAGFRDEDPGLYQMFQQMDYPEPGPDCSFDPDARVLVWYGRRYSLTPNGAGVVGMLFEAWEKGRPEVSLDRIKSVVYSRELDDSLYKVFRRSVVGGKIIDPVWNVIETVGKGLYRLAERQADERGS